MPVKKQQLSKNLQYRLTLLIKKLAEGEQKVEKARNVLANCKEYDPNMIFRTLAKPGQLEVSPEDVVYFLKDKGIYVEVEEAALTLFFYDRDHDRSLTYAEIFNLLGTKKPGNVTYGKEDKIPVPLMINLRNLLEAETKLAREVLAILKGLQSCEEFNIHDIFHFLKEEAVITEENIMTFFKDYGEEISEDSAKNVFNRLDINKDTIVDFCEFHAFLGFPKCGYTCPCSPCKECGAKYCQNCLGTVPCYLLGCDHSGYNSIMECKSKYHSMEGGRDGSDNRQIKMGVEEIITTTQIDEEEYTKNTQNNKKTNNVFTAKDERRNRAGPRSGYEEGGSYGHSHRYEEEKIERRTQYMNSGMGNMGGTGTVTSFNYNTFGSGRRVYEIKTEEGLYKPGFVDPGVDRLSETLGLRCGGDRIFSFTGCKNPKCPCNPENPNHHDCNCSSFAISFQKSQVNYETPLTNFQAPYTYNTFQNFNTTQISNMQNNFNTTNFTRTYTPRSPMIQSNNPDPLDMTNVRRTVYTTLTKPKPNQVFTANDMRTNRIRDFDNDSVDNYEKPNEQTINISKSISEDRISEAPNKQYINVIHQNSKNEAADEPDDEIITQTNVYNLKNPKNSQISQNNPKKPKKVVNVNYVHNINENEINEEENDPNNRSRKGYSKTIVNNIVNNENDSVDYGDDNNRGSGNGGMKKITTTITKHEIEENDDNNDGKITIRGEKEFIEYLRLLMVLEKDIERAKQDLATQKDFNVEDAFRLFVKDDKEIVTKNDIKFGLQLLGLKLDDFALKILINRYDLDGEGAIDYSDFFDMVVPYEENMREEVDKRPSRVEVKNRTKDLFTKETRKKFKEFFELIINHEIEISKYIDQNLDEIKMRMGELQVKLDSIQKDGVCKNDEFINYLKDHDIFMGYQEAYLVFIRLDKNRDGDVPTHELQKELDNVGEIAVKKENNII